MGGEERAGDGGVHGGDEWVEVVGGEDHIDLRAGARGRAEAGGGGDIGAGDVGADGACDELDEGVVAAEAAAREATADGVDPVDEEGEEEVTHI